MPRRTGLAGRGRYGGGSGSATGCAAALPLPRPPAAVPTTGVPTTEESVRWLEAWPGTEKPVPGPYAGKWMLFEIPSCVDALWDRLKEAMDQGKLAGAVQVAVSTKGGKRFREPRHAVFVSTADWRDRDDVARCLASLRVLGVEDLMHYRPDSLTPEARAGLPMGQTWIYDSFAFPEANAMGPQQQVPAPGMR